MLVGLALKGMYFYNDEEKRVREANEKRQNGWGVLHLKWLATSN